MLQTTGNAPFVQFFPGLGVASQHRQFVQSVPAPLAGLGRIDWCFAAMP